MSLPHFKYHPDPVATGSVVATTAQCQCCGQARGFIYTGPVYAEEELEASLCPWCIANGAAHAKFGATFTDEAGIGGWGDWDPVPAEVVLQVAERTPGFAGWQQERWWTHCGDAGAFLGRAGHSELLAHGEDALRAIQLSIGLPAGPKWEKFLGILDKDGSPTAYVFRCSACGMLGGYHDFD